MKSMATMETHEETGVIMEDEIECKKNNLSNLFDNDESDRLNIVKKSGRIVHKTSVKLKKNFSCCLSIIVILVVYYIVLFECLMPMYEARMFNKNEIKNVKRNQTEFSNNDDIKINSNFNFLSELNNRSNNTGIFYNRASFYIILYHIFIFIFLISFIRSSLADPGEYHSQYVNLFSLQKYQELYSRFILNVVYLKKKQEKQNNSLEYPQMNFRSNSLLKKQVKEEDSDVDSIIVDKDEKYISKNQKMKLFHNELKNFRNNNTYKNFWSLNCQNFRHRSLRDNICRFCLILKPERAFHCKNCKRCIRKMDHHCFFINNCIGYSSYKFFINLLFYASLISALSVIIMLESMKFIFNEYSFCIFSGFFLILVFVMCIIGSLVFYFFCYHLSLILRGVSQLEDLFRFEQRYEEYYDFLQNLSKWERFTSVFGSNPFYWFLPLSIIFNIVESSETLDDEGYVFRK